MERKIKIFLWLFAASLVLSACATSFDKRGVYHNVRSGDTIWRIASTYGIDVQELAEYNNLFKPEDVQPGKRIYIPPKSKKRSFKKLPMEISSSSAGGKRSGKVAKKKFKDEGSSKSIRLYRGRFDWPLEGKVGSLFGMRSGKRHDGVDISAPSGTPIHAAAHGKVVFVGQMRGYGNLILIRHEDDFFTAYAHNSINRVRKDQNIKKGDVIGSVGRTGRATAPHLHFEIRHGQTARNPLFFLPESNGILVKYEKKKRKH